MTESQQQIYYRPSSQSSLGYVTIGAEEEELARTNNLTSVCMNRRKACLHPMLSRWRFTDQTLIVATNVLLTDPEFRKRGAEFNIVNEDMRHMTDAELQLLFTEREVCLLILHRWAY